jgi:hypothetical protein
MTGGSRVASCSSRCGVTHVVQQHQKIVFVLTQLHLSGGNTNSP